MELTLSQLRTHTTVMKEALSRGEKIELTERGNVIGIIKSAHDLMTKSKKQKALEALWKCCDNEATLDARFQKIRQGRKGRSLDL